jgi:hypothetical protein
MMPIRKRGNDYYLRRMKVEHPSVYQEYADGRLSAKEAIYKVGYQRRPAPLDILKREWKKASAAETGEFIRAGIRSPRARKVARPWHPVATADRRLPAEAKKRIQTVLSARSLTGSQAMADMGFSALNASLSTALRNSTTIRDEVIRSLETWLEEHDHIYMSNTENQDIHSVIDELGSLDCETGPHDAGAASQTSQQDGSRPVADDWPAGNCRVMNNRDTIAISFPEDIAKRSKLAGVHVDIADILRWQADAMPAIERKRADRLRWIASEFFADHNWAGDLGHELDQIDLDEVETKADADAVFKTICNIRNSVVTEVENAVGLPLEKLAEYHFGLVDARDYADQLLERLHALG